MNGMADLHIWNPHAAPTANGRPQVGPYRYQDPKRRSGPSQVWLALANLQTLLDRYEPSPEQWAVLAAMLPRDR